MKNRQSLLIALGLGVGAVGLFIFWLAPHTTSPTNELVTNDPTKDDLMSNFILDHPQVGQVLFHPRPEWGTPSDPTQFYPVAVEVEADVSVGGRLYPADTTSSVILFFHGNGEIAADYDDLAPFYTRQGITLLVMDYRGYGVSEGTPTGSNLVNDGPVVFTALNDILAENDLAPDRVYVMGRSLGSVPAIEIAANAGDKIAGLIIESGFADTFALLHTLGIAVREANEAQHGFGNGEKISRVTVPTLIIHGENDVLIPASEGQALYDRSGSAAKELLLIPNAGHNNIMMVGLNQYFEAIGRFVHSN